MPLPAAPPTSRSARALFWLYWGHLAGLFGLAIGGAFAIALAATPRKTQGSQIARMQSG